MPTITFDSNLRSRDVAGIRRRNLVLYTGPKSYATGGDAIAAADVDLGFIESINGDIALNAAGPTIYFLAFNRATAAGGPSGGKMLWMTATGTEVGAGTDLSAATAILEFVGR